MSDVAVCVICSNRASSRIEKNGEFRSAMNLFWKLSDIDVKPGENDHLDLCRACHTELEQILATHEAWILLKGDLKKCRAKLVEDVKVGLAKRKTRNMPFLGIHTKLQASVRKNS